MSPSRTFVLQGVVGHLSLGALLQVSIVQDFMVGRQAAVPELVWKKGNTWRVRAALKEPEIREKSAPGGKIR